MNRLIGNTILAVVLVGLSVLAVCLFNRAAAPQEKILPVEGALSPDYAGMLQDISPDSLEAHLEALCAQPSRFSGTPGCEKVADHIERTLRGLGYDVTSQPFGLTVPMTKFAEVTDLDGVAVEDVSVLPMIPNWFRTATTPPEGLEGTVFIGERGLAREFEGKDVDGNFVLLPLGVSWSTVAAMGASAVLYYDDGRKTVSQRWDHHKDASFNVPRFLVTGEAASLEGRRLRLRARVDFEERRTRNIVAIIDVPGSPEAIVVNTYYDAYSYVPDAAPGAGPACSTAVFLDTARRLAAERSKLRRSVVLVATSGHAQGIFGMREFMRAVGMRDGRQKAVLDAATDLDEKKAELQRVKAATIVARDDAYWAADSREAEAAYWAGREAATEATFADLVRRVLDEDLMAAVEATTQARVDWIRDDMSVRAADGTESRTFVAYDEARATRQRVQGILATPLGRAKSQWADHLREAEVRRRVVETAGETTKLLGWRVSVLEARVSLARALARYERPLFLGIDVTAATEGVAVVCGEYEQAANCMPADAEVMAQVQGAGEELDAASGTDSYVRNRKGHRIIANLVREKDEVSLSFITTTYGTTMYFESPAAFWAGYPAFTLSTRGDTRGLFGTPFDTLERMLTPPETVVADQLLALDRLTITARLVAATITRFALGHGRVVPIQQAPSVHTIRGQVVSRIGENLTPDQPMRNAIVRIGPVKRWSTPINPFSGMGSDICLTADDTGHFELAYVWPEGLAQAYKNPIDIDAAALDAETGEITWTLCEQDSGPMGPYKTVQVKIAQYDKSLAMPVLFRCKAMQVVPMPDPATLKSYAGFGFVDRKGLAAPQKSKVEKTADSYVCYVPPEIAVYFTFKKGSRTNPNLTEIRAFALNAKGAADGSEVEGEGELQGEGYLAEDHASVKNIELDAAVSMAQVNSRRLRTQQRHNMADDMVIEYNAKAVGLAEHAKEQADAGDLVAAKRTAAASVAYSSNIHPVIRKNASDAIIGILFYLFLSVPFAIFMEKLLVGHPDLRYQIAFQGVIFIFLFFALRAVHPAYELVRSSYMILLGFITFALAVMVSAFVSGRFASNIKELQQRFQQRQEVADVSRAGAAMTAFILGLGHMRKRKVRTGLTVGTLVLTTFVMLCFTSVTTDVVDVEFAVGNAPYTGLLVRDRALTDVRSSLAPLRELYGRDHVVVPREWAGNFKVTRGTAVERKSIIVTRDVEDRTLEVEAFAALGLAAREPEVTPVMDALVHRVRWFETDREYACFLPQDMADGLRILDSEIDAGTAVVKVGSASYTVLGIYDGQKMGSVLDLDGEPILPLDILGLMKPGQEIGGQTQEDTTDVPDSVQRLPGNSVLITSAEALPGRERTGSVAVSFRGLDYAASREIITTHLERSAEPAYYGIDGIAFYGGKFRMRTMEGFIDLLLPIIIAALTVLNTMRGSVYERQDELYVFNSVGLSPAHIRSLFLAEASVYAVVGAVGGYLLAQGVGAALKVLDVTAGLTMNYSSLASVLVSVIIMAVVFVSSIFPARMASRLAAPADTMTRERETSEGDVMELDLPFTFNRRDRVAIIPYFVDWFENYGEGSSGEYFCGPPECGIEAEEHGGAAPYVRATAWLKPYDLGVSQDVKVVVRYLPDTDDNVATVVMTRKSGDRDSWERCCHAFIGLLRKRFLTWRAIGDGPRQELLERGRKQLEATLGA